MHSARIRFGIVAIAMVMAGPAIGQERPRLVWGGDKVGGAPYIFDDGDKQVGFETELAEYLAAELGRQAKFEQVPWDNLPDALANKTIHIALNGIEHTEEREEGTRASLPYFIYNLRLIAPRAENRRGEKTVRSWNDLPAKDGNLGRRVSVLKGSASQDYMEKRFGSAIELIKADDVAEMLGMVADGRADASVQDSPAARYYVAEKRMPTLMLVDEPVAENFYVVLLREEDAQLRDDINAALRKAVKTGKLKEILKNYNLWSGDQQRLDYFYGREWPPAEDDLFAESEEDQQAKQYSKITIGMLRERLMRAALMTLALAFASMPIALALGLLVALGRMYGPWIVRAPLTAYVEILRGTPLILQMFLWFYLVPQLLQSTEIGILIAMTNVPYFVYGVVGLALNYSASEAENFRAGLQAIPRGQMEAALALGMNARIALRRVVVPQAFRVVIPSITNDFIALLKDTSVCSLILITELTGLYYQYKYHREIVVELALTVSVIYLFLSFPLSIVARRLETRLRRDKA